MRIVTQVTPGKARKDLEDLSQAAEGLRKQNEGFPTHSSVQDRLHNYAEEIKRSFDKSGESIADLYSNQVVSALYNLTERGKAKVVGLEEELLELKKARMLEASSLEFPAMVGGLPLISYYIEPYMENGRVVYDKNGAPLFVAKARYGYRLFERKPHYNVNMYKVLSGIYERARQQRVHLGNLVQDTINSRNAMITEDDLIIYGMTPFRNKGSYGFDKFSGVNRLEYVPRYKRAIIGIWEFLKGPYVGPRLDLLVGPSSRERLELIIPAFTEGGFKTFTSEEVAA